jgi:hypothetical protein
VVGEGSKMSKTDVLDRSLFTFTEDEYKKFRMNELFHVNDRLRKDGTLFDALLSKDSVFYKTEEGNKALAFLISLGDE